MKNQIQSIKDVFWSAKSWSTIIGYAQITAGAVNLALLTYRFLGQSDQSKEVDAEVKIEHEKLIIVIKENKEALLTLLKSMGVVVFKNGLIILAILLASGITLIFGVKQKNAGILRIWQMLQIVFLVVFAFQAVSLISAEWYSRGVLAIVLMLGTIVAICVVDRHRVELKDALNAVPAPGEGSPGKV